MAGILYLIGYGFTNSTILSYVRSKTLSSSKNTRSTSQRNEESGIAMSNTQRNTQGGSIRDSSIKSETETTTGHESSKGQEDDSSATDD
jgi:hypothetical protein